MNPKKKILFIILNAVIVILNILLFSNLFFGLSLFAGTALSIAFSWTVVAISIFAFFQGNIKLLKKKETTLFLTKNVQELKDCTAALKEATQHGDVFDEDLFRNIDQIKRFERKRITITDILLQKFSADELSFQKFNSVLQDIEKVIYINMRSILNKISAFDVEEYESILKGVQDEFSQQKMEIYNEYIYFVNNATKTNEDILLKLDKMLLEISKYNSMEDGDIQKLPAIMEMDELIRNASLYK